MEFKWRRLITLTLLLVVVAGASYGYYRWKKSRSTPQYFAAQADAAMKAKNYPAAISYLKQLLEAAPKNDQVRLMLANLHRRIAHSPLKDGVQESDLVDPVESLPYLEQIAKNQYYNVAVRERLLRDFIFYRDKERSKRIAKELLALRAGTIEAVNFLVDDLVESQYWEEADDLMGEVGWNLGYESPIYLRLQIRVLYARKRYQQLDKLLAETLDSQARKPAQQLTGLNARELRFLDNVLNATIKIAGDEREAGKRLLQALNVLHKMVLVTEPVEEKVMLVEAAMSVVETFSATYPPPKKRLRFAKRAGIHPSVHDAAALALLKMATPLVKAGKANAKIYEHVARAARWVDDDSRSITLLREGLNVFEELPPKLRSELISMHRDAALEMIARHDLGDGKVAPLMKNSETEAIGNLLGAQLAIDRNELSAAKVHVEKARTDSHLETACDALSLRIYMASKDWAAALALVEELDNGWSELPLSDREWLTKTQGGRESAKVIRAFCHYKLHQTEDLVEVAKTLEGTPYQAKARLLQIADLVREHRIEQAGELTHQSRQSEPANFNLIMANVGLLADTGNIPQALQLLGSYVSNFPEDVRGHVVLARWLTQTGETQQAQSMLEQTMSQFPDEPAARMLTAELLFNEQKNTELNKLLRTFRRPETANLILLITTTFELRRQGYSTAAEALLEGVPGMPSNSNMALANAAVSFSKGLTQTGFEQLAETVNIRPTKNAPRSVFLQELNTALQAPAKEKLQLLDDLVKKYPQDPTVLLVASDISVRRGRLEQALLRIEELDSVDTVAGRAEYARAKILQLAGRDTAALNAVEEIFADVPEHQAGRLLACQLEYALKNYGAALEHLEHVSPEAKNSNEMLFLRAEALTQLDRTREAEPLLAEYVRREPDKDLARVNLALLIRDHGRIEEAIYFLGGAIQRMPNNRPLQTAYLDLLAESGRIRELERATKLFTNEKPDGPMALRLARTFVTAGQFEEARRWLSEARTMLRGDSATEVSFLEGYIAYEKGRRSGYHNFFVQAHAKFSQVLKRKPTHVAALRSALPLALFHFNDLGQAVEYANNLRKAVLARRLTEQDVDGIAEALRQTGQLDEALDVVLTALKRLPQSAAIRFQYGALTLETAETTEQRQLAKQQLEMAIQLGIPAHHLSELNAMLESFNKPDVDQDSVEGKSDGVEKKEQDDAKAA